MLELRRPDPNVGAFRLLAVIVLYRMKPVESATVKSLHAATLPLLPGQAEIATLLYDNTPGGQDAGVLPSDVQYIADPANGGLAKAYNYALEIAQEEGYDWLLTLDQDTTLPDDFLLKLSAAARFVQPLGEVAAIVPHISGDGRVISPSIPTKHWAHWKYFSDQFVGISMERFTLAVNSASTLRVSSLKAIGGYDPRYWMDFSDVLLYHRLHQNNFRVFVAGNIHVKHEASVLDLKNRVSPDRYENIDRAEQAFYDEYLGTMEGAVLLLRLVYRLTYKLFRQRATLPYFKVALRFLYDRLFRSRKRRMELWNQTVRPQSITSSTPA